MNKLEIINRDNELGIKQILELIKAGSGNLNLSFSDESLNIINAKTSIIFKESTLFDKSPRIIFIEKIYFSNKYIINISKKFIDQPRHLFRRLYGFINFLEYFIYKEKSLSKDLKFILDLTDGYLINNQRYKLLEKNLLSLSTIPFITFCIRKSILNQSSFPIILAPDPHFYLSKGYVELKDKIKLIIKKNSEFNFSDSKSLIKKAYWRGGPNGISTTGSIKDIDRIIFTKKVINNPSFNVKLVSNDNFFNKYENLKNIRGEREDFSENMKYFISIDIDGNTTSWTGNYGKLLLGCNIIKLTSKDPLIQWYYKYEFFENCLTNCFSIDELIKVCENQLLNIKKFKNEIINRKNMARKFALNLNYSEEAKILFYKLIKFN